VTLNRIIRLLDQRSFLPLEKQMSALQPNNQNRNGLEPSTTAFFDRWALKTSASVVKYNAGAGNYLVGKGVVSTPALLEGLLLSA